MKHTVLSHQIKVKRGGLKKLANVKILQLAKELRLLKKRNPLSHKGDFGHVLVIGGDYGMSGAVRMTAQAALRVGAGLVSVATRREHASVINAMCPEVMASGIQNITQLKKLLDNKDVVAIGPGLGTSSFGKSIFKKVIAAQKCLVVDADALNILAKNRVYYNNWVLTPHPGEAARLLNVSVKEIQDQRLESACKIQKLYGGVCVLKGHGTLVVNADGDISICNNGNPGMATAGMGDILTGVIAGLIAQDLSLSDAAKLGVLVHAVAGDRQAREYGERGMLATDLLPRIRAVVNLM